MACRGISVRAKSTLSEFQRYIKSRSSNDPALMKKSGKLIGFARLCQYFLAKLEIPIA